MNSVGTGTLGFIIPGNSAEPHKNNAKMVNHLPTNCITDKKG